jgi:serine protease
MALAWSRSIRVHTAAFAVSTAMLAMSACSATPATTPSTPPATSPPATSSPTTSPPTTSPPAAQPGPNDTSGACSPLGLAAASDPVGQANASGPAESLTPQQAAAKASTAFVYALIDPTVPGGPGSVPVVVTSLDSQGRPEIHSILTANVDQARQEVEAISTDSVAKGQQVVSVEPESELHAMGSAVTNDPYRPSQWSLTQLDFESTWSSSNGSGVCVAVVDSGIALNHPDLAGKVAASADWTGEGVSSYGNHATHVAGIIAAKPNNSQGIVGAAPGVSLLNAKALTAALGEGTTSGVAQAIVWAVDNGARVINASIGGTSGSSALLQAINYAQAHDVVFIASAGNEGLKGNPSSWPASYEWPIATASITDTGALSPFSTQASYVDVAAPGSSILSTLTSNRYGYMSGTSMAAPHVAALAALARAAHPSESATQIRSRIENTATDSGSAGWDSSFGWGVISPSAAVR